MKIVIAIVSVLAIGLIGLVVMNSSNKSSSDKVDISTVATDVAAGGQLIDVRTIEEFATSRIEGATNLPVESIQGGVMPSAAKDAKIYVYCRSGNRSAQAKTALDNAGYKNVVDLGGYNEVVAIGGKMVQ